MSWSRGLINKSDTTASCEQSKYKMSTIVWGTLISLSYILYGYYKSNYTYNMQIRIKCGAVIVNHLKMHHTPWEPIIKTIKQHCTTKIKNLIEQNKKKKNWKEHNKVDYSKVIFFF